MNPSTQQARVVVDELVRLGVTDAVLCPGSRNAPLAFALHAADAAGRLRLHVRIDERTAGFLALGLALGSGRPVPVVTTSGTAVANLHPAVLEASYSGVPLLAVTADRPPELVGTGASQTVDQRGIFGTAVRESATLAVAGAADASGRWRAAVDRVVAAATGARGGVPGPVQLNVPFAEPLVPDPDPDPDPASRDLRAGGAWTVVAPVTRTAPPLPLDPAAPTVVVAGAGAGVDPALLGGTPLVAEPGSPLWAYGLRAGPWLLGTPGCPRPEQAVVIGRPTLHRAVFRLLADPEVAVHVVADPQGGPWPDVAGTVRAVGSLPQLTPAPAWVARWREADAAASAALDRVLDATAPAPPGPAVLPGQAVPLTPPAPSAPTARPEPTCRPNQPGPVAAPEPTVQPAPPAPATPSEPTAPATSGQETQPLGLRLARDLVAAVPEGARVVVGSSNPVRDVALAAVPRPGVTILSNRGVAGIDGTVSTAVGAALTHPGPTVALLGDLTLLHDTTGLLIGPDEPTPALTIVVLNDRGGGIFALLEQGAPAHAGSFERIFGTPHRADLGAVAAGFGAAHTLVEDLADLPAALAEPAKGIRIVEVRATRQALRKTHRALADAVATAVTDVSDP